MDRRIRVLIAKIGLDGHDRGAKLIVRNMRDAGMEVIYTGLWQTPASTVHAAVQEDVDVVGISLLSAAHMTIMPEVRRLAVAAGVPDLPLVVGGIIPEADHPLLKAEKIDGVFNPGTPMSTIIETTRELAARYRALPEAPPDLSTATGLARAISAIINERPLNTTTLRGPTPAAKFIRIGVTGAPGVGKSTFIGRLARALRARNQRVAVVAIDPTSPLTGGSLLGDRLRMMSSEPDDGLFVRSLASSGVAGGLAPHVAEVIELLPRAGYPIVLIETVGAGQNDVEIRKLADEVALVVMPGAGDTIQYDKAGIVEIATAFVVNKADLPGADKTVKDLRDSLSDDRPIWRISALRGEGLEPICEWIERRV